MTKPDLGVYYSALLWQYRHNDRLARYWLSASRMDSRLSRDQQDFIETVADVAAREREQAAKYVVRRPAATTFVVQDATVAAAVERYPSLARLHGVEPHHPREASHVRDFMDECHHAA